MFTLQSNGESGGLSRASGIHWFNYQFRCFESVMSTSLWLPKMFCSEQSNELFADSSNETTTRGQESEERLNKKVCRVFEKHNGEKRPIAHVQTRR